MADKWYTAASGNWSTAANWNGGTLPIAGDDVYADGKAVTIDQTVNVGSIRTTQRAGGTLGGTFTIAAAQTITCTSSIGMTSGTLAGGILITATTGTVTINSNVTAPPASIVIDHSGACALSINGNLTGGSTTNGRALFVSASNTTQTIVGNITGGTAATTNGVSYSGSSNTLTVTGIVTGGASSGFGIRSDTNNTIIVIGSVIGGTASGISVSSTNIVSITGTLTANIGNALSSTTACDLTVSGTITSTSSVNAISMTSTTSTLTISGQIVNVGGRAAIDCRGLTYLHSSNSVSHVYQTSGSNRTMFAIANSDVRSGVGTGTLIVPNPSLVVSGVPTDNTVGTYSATPALIATEIFTKLLSNSDFNTSGSFGKLIKDNVDAKSSEIKAKTDLIPTNPASVQSVGAIVASYNV
jgi:hypothetical protein